MRPGVQNYQMAVSEANGEIVFLRKVVADSASKSYGIEVAWLAGLPRSVLDRTDHRLFTRQIMFPASSATSNDPSRATATPTGLP